VLAEAFAKGISQSVKPVESEAGANALVARSRLCRRKTGLPDAAPNIETENSRAWGGSKNENQKCYEIKRWLAFSRDWSVAPRGFAQYVRTDCVK